MRTCTSYAQITDESEEETSQTDSWHTVEFGLAPVFEGNIKGFQLAACIVRPFCNCSNRDCYSIRLVRISAWSNLMVLSYGQPQKGHTRDGLLFEDAQNLFAEDLYCAGDTG